MFFAGAPQPAHERTRILMKWLTSESAAIRMKRVTDHKPTSLDQPPANLDPPEMPSAPLINFADSSFCRRGMNVS